MSIGRKTGGKDFLPGQSGNPAGRPPIPEEVKEYKKINQVKFIEMVNKYMFMDRASLLAMQKSPNTKAIDLMIIALIIKTVNQGDYSRLNFLLDRTIGKVVEKIEHFGKDGGPIQTQEISPEERAARKVRIADKIKKFQIINGSSS